MGVFALPVSLLLFGLVVLIEATRVKKRCYIDFLFPVNFMFVLLFCVVPPYLMTLDSYGFLSSSHWVFKNQFSDINFLLASLVVMAGYLSLIFGYYFKYFNFHPSDLSQNQYKNKELDDKYSVFNEKHLLVAGILLGAVGSLALFFYAYSLGGVRVMIEYSAAFRSSNPPVISKYAFLKNVAPFVLISSYFFFAIIQTTKVRSIQYMSVLLFVVTFLLSMTILFHQSGRLQLFAYLIIFPIAIMIRRNRLDFKTILLFIVLFVFITLLGKEMFHYFIHPQSVANKIEVVLDKPMISVDYILLEFTFPYVTLANAIKVVPTDVAYRWFIDIPVSLIYMLPQRLLELKDLPPTVTMVNVAQFNAPIPVDLLSFSYFSMGLPGVLIVCFSYGLLLRVFDNFLPANSQPIVIIFRAAWIMFFAFNIMYGNPHHALVSGFPLIIGTFILLMIRKFASKPEPVVMFT